MENETYLDNEGLLRCSKCGGKRETLVKFRDKAAKVSCVCQCQREAIEAEERADKERELKRKAEELRKDGFFYKSLAKYTFDIDDGSQPKVMHIAKKYVENFDTFKAQGKGILFYGGVGTGKTYAAACIANALIDKGIPVMMTNFNRIANKLQERFGKAQEFLDSLNKYQLLIVDDLATERNTEYMQEIVFNIIDARYSAELPIIITTNLDYNDIKTSSNTVNSRIYDRIVEKCYPVAVFGKSHRRKDLEKNIETMKKMLESE